MVATLGIGWQHGRVSEGPVPGHGTTELNFKPDLSTKLFRESGTFNPGVESCTAH